MPKNTDYALTEYDLSIIKKMAEAAEEKGTEMGVPIVFAAVDEGGNLILVHRQADSLLASIDIAINKAYTAAALKQPTANLWELSNPANSLHGIQNTNNGRIVVFGGGIPIFVNGRIAGGLGISGGTVEEDIIIVDYALDSVSGL